MNKIKMNKYRYKLMIKNNPEEAIKNLILKDELQEELDFIKEDANDILYKLTLVEEKNLRLKNLINKVIDYIEENCIDDEFYINLTKKERHIIVALNMLLGEE